MNMTTNEVKKNDSCETHGDYEYTEYTLMGKVLGHRCPVCAEANDARIKEERIAAIESERAEKIGRLFGNAMIPKRFADKTFENYIAETQDQKKALSIAVRYADKWQNRLENGGGLILSGVCGTGKTHLSAAIANKIIRDGYPAVFTSVMKMARDVKSTYSRDSEYSEGEIIDKYISPDLLIIDEVGVQYGSDAEKIILFEILNGRYENVKPTILISNLSESELPEYLGERLIDRMREGGGATVSFTWDSFR